LTKSKNVASLSVHRNTRDQRRRHQASEGLRNAVRLVTRHKSCDEFILMAWDNKGNESVCWSVDGTVDIDTLPGRAKHAVQRKLNRLDNYEILDPPPQDDGA